MFTIMIHVYLYCFVLLFMPINCASTADNFHESERPCSQSSPECSRHPDVVLPSFIKGIPELGIRSLNPFEVENLVFRFPSGVTIEIRQIYTEGLRRCSVVLARNIGGDQYEAKFRCNLSMEGVYRSKGQLFKVPIDGEGDSLINCRGLTITCYFRIVPLKKPDGDFYLQVQDFESTHDFESRVSFHLANFIPGNRGIRTIALKYLNQNWRSLVRKF